MGFLNRINFILQKCMPIITPTSLILGVFLADHLSPWHFAVPWIFAFMTFSSSLNCGFQDLRNVVRSPKPLLIILFLLHVWMPLLAFAAGHLFFSCDPCLISGILIEFIIPTGIISLIWVTMYNGNVALTLSVILLDTILSPFLIPPTLKVLVGAAVKISVWSMMKDLLLMIALPAVLALALHDLSKGKVTSRLFPRLAPFNKLAIIPVIAINSTKLAPFFHDMQPIYLYSAAAIFLLAASGYLWGVLASKLFGQSRENTISIFFNGSLRNISAGAVIAAQFFPGEALFPVMIGTLFQQTLAACAGAWLARKMKKSDSCEYSGSIEHLFRKFRAPSSGKAVHTFPGESATIN